MSDAAETLLSLYSSINAVAGSSKPLDDILGLEVLEFVHCSSCGRISHRQQYVQVRAADQPLLAMSTSLHQPYASCKKFRPLHAPCRFSGASYYVGCTVEWCDAVLVHFVSLVELAAGSATWTSPCHAEWLYRCDLDADVYSLPCACLAQYFYEVPATALRDTQQRMDSASLGELLRTLAAHQKTCDVDAPFRACTTGLCAHQQL